MTALLSSPSPAEDELERAAIWLSALDLLVNRISAELVPDFDSLAVMLEATQSAFRRWVWDARPNRREIGPARWLIDSEAHVQAFLWAILEPRFGDDLVDEQYLPGFEQKQPRFDFGVRRLKTIVEVKMVRSASDFSKIEEEFAGDLGLYFMDLPRWDRMIVYIYDDSNVIFVQRPGMIPPRNRRALWSPLDGSSADT